MTGEVIALTLTAVVHVVGAVVLVWAMFDSDDRPDWRSLWPRDDGDDGGGSPPVDPPRKGPSDGGLRLPDDAVPARVRLREPGRLADGRPRPARRPAHPPAPSRTPAER